ncbi:MAG: hypothetical protein SWK76_04540 [Actinomycetota bacterium]|nr:hypothetical protein [Actinomycetota bacterium]
MAADGGPRKGWLRLVAVVCTLLLAASVFLVLGVTVWAQESEQEPGTETQESGEEAQQPEEEAAEEQVEEVVVEEETAGEITIEYWEPQIGTRTVYYTNDFMNDVYGQEYGTSTLGYADDSYLWWTTRLNWNKPLNFSSSYYKSVDAISDMNMVYFDLEGPWYFNMTTPWKIVEEVIGIHEAPDAGHFPEATYAVWRLAIGSGGHRYQMIEYCSNDAEEMTWNTWGYSIEYFPNRSERSTKDIVHFRSPYDKELGTAYVERFPKMLGETGSVDALYMSAGPDSGTSDSGTYEVIAEGKITLPGGTYDALLIKYDMSVPCNKTTFTRISYVWFVQDIGTVVRTRSLPNIIDPMYEEASGYCSTNNSKYYFDSDGMIVLEEFTAPQGQ